MPRNSQRPKSNANIATDAANAGSVTITDAKTSQIPAAPAAEFTLKSSDPEQEKRNKRKKRAEEVLDLALERGTEDEDLQVKTALAVLKMDNAKEEAPRAFGSVIIQEKLSRADWEAMCERMRSLSK